MTLKNCLTDPFVFQPIFAYQEEGKWILNSNISFSFLMAQNKFKYKLLKTPIWVIKVV